MSISNLATFDLVTHPCKISLIPNLIINYKEDVTPIGMLRYNVTCEINSDLHLSLLSIAAKPYYLALPTDVLECYSISDFEKMCKLYFFKKLGCAPDGFDIVRYQDPKVTHYYPMYNSYNSVDSEYLYVCSEELRLLEFDPLSILGLFPISNNSLSWNQKTFIAGLNNINWGEARLLESRVRSVVVENEIEKLRQMIERDILRLERSS